MPLPLKRWDLRCALPRLKSLSLFLKVSSQKSMLSLVVMTNTFNYITLAVEAGGLFEFVASLVYIVNSRPIMALE